jgi:glutamine synthetase
MAKIKLEYIWVDGQSPTAELRSKTKVIDSEKLETPGRPFNKGFDIEKFPIWSFDGSSTEQADGNDSDCLLKPVSYYLDPFRNSSFLVMCEVLNPDGTPHKTNNRRKLVEAYNENKETEPLFGIEQEYVFLENKLNKNSRQQLLGWPKNEGNMVPQGRYYCGVGADRVIGREIAEEHMEMCLNANIGITGINAEVMASQWEYQVGTLGPLEVSDQLWISRWILNRVCEKYNVKVTIEPKPLKGDWNGSGAHINFSTKEMREEGGIKAIEDACEKLSLKHKEHIDAYGSGNEDRLTGKHETCDINTFRYGVADRGASIRIPRQVSENGCGYLEDRRPSSNVDPYKACAALIKTVCNESELVC